MPALVIPFSNSGCQYKAWPFAETALEDRIPPLGLFLTFIVAAMVLPLLLAADVASGFEPVNRILTDLAAHKS